MTSRIMAEYIKIVAKVCKWHNTCTITIPKMQAEELNLERGDTVEVLVRKMWINTKIRLEEEN